MKCDRFLHHYRIRCNWFHKRTARKKERASGG